MTKATVEPAGGPVEQWLEEIAQVTGQSVDAVREVLDRHSVRAQTVLPRPHRLQVTKVDFEGVRPAPAPAPAAEAGQETPFRFEWELGPGLWCLASSGKNEAGKSSVLEVVLWCLRGRSSLQRDVQSWLRRVRLEFLLDDEVLVVDMAVSDGRPSGSVVDKQTGVELVEFDSATSFEELMDAFMMNRLGLEPLRTQQKRPEDADGLPFTGELSWPAYASGLHINRSGLGHLLGNDARNALPTRLLELFLGAPWASTMVAASVAMKVVAAQLSAARNKRDAEAEDRASKLAELEATLAAAHARVDALPDTGRTAADLTEAYRRLSAATGRAAEAQRAVSLARVSHDVLEQRRQDLAATLHAAQEAALAKAFFHTLKPTVCPRCDAAVTAAQWAREEEGHCSLCTSELHPAADEPVEPVSDGDEAEDVDDENELRLTLETVNAAIAKAETELAQRQNQVRSSEAELEAAQSALQNLLQTPETGDRRAAELEVARLEGALAERQGGYSDLGDPTGVVPLERDHLILKAAEKAAHARRTKALKDVLTAVEEDIVAMGRQLGLEMLETAELDTAAKLKVKKGGKTQPYGSLTEGEQLRIKIVTTIALLRHGIRTGVGRHPGLLIVDSPGAEEVDSGDLRLMLKDLVQLTAIAPELQIVVATARGQEVASVVPEGQLRLAPEGERLW